MIDPLPYLIQRLKEEHTALHEELTALQKDLATAAPEDQVALINKVAAKAVTVQNKKEELNQVLLQKQFNLNF